MLFMFYDWTWIVLIPAFLIALYAQYKVTSTFSKMSKIPNLGNWTGELVAKELLESQGVFDVKVAGTKGGEGDHYNPQTKVISLTNAVYTEATVLSVGVAAHEAGHAIQDNRGYFLLRFRTAIVPIVNVTSNMSIWMIFIGFIFTGNMGPLFINLGIIFFLLGVVFQLITLPVEIDASRTAIALLESNNMVNESERVMIEEVLQAAALTYVASAAMAISQLMRILLLTRGRRDREK